MPRRDRTDRSAPSGGARSDGAGSSGIDWTLGAIAAAVDARLNTWSDADAVSRIWRRDASFWPTTPPSAIASGLGWLEAPMLRAERVAELGELAREVRAEGFEHVVLLGMGGSSLAPQVIARMLPHSSDGPDLTVLDSTHPSAVRACLERAPVDRSLYLVSSKSGTTLEPNVLFRFFWERAASLSSPGRRFVAVTDAGTPLERLAHDKRFRACFLAPTDVVGRYSALTVFGLLPSALVGVDVEGLLRSARAMAERCAETADPRANPGLCLGAALGELGRAGRDKLVFLPSPSLAPFPGWAEQLVSESTGKLDRGLVPVVAPQGDRELPAYPDVAYLRLGLDGEGDRALESQLDARAGGGTPVLRFRWRSPLELGGEFFRWEFAIATAASILEVNPFDQPDVERAKELAREAMEHPAPAGREPYGLQLREDAAPALERWLSRARPGDYVAVQAFLAPTEGTDTALRHLASALAARLGTVVTVGYGPRFLHSTGQLHKGGPRSGLFLQIVDEPSDDLQVPDLHRSFGGILRAQARGDRDALEERDRRLLVVNTGPRPLERLQLLVDLLRRGPGTPAARS